MKAEPTLNCVKDEEMFEADDILDQIERGSFDYSRPSGEIVSDLVKVAKLCVQLRLGIVELEIQRRRCPRW